MPRVTLLTDFGTADGYVGALKGVIAGVAPQALIDDVSHDIAPGDIAGAAWALEAYWRLYPAGTVHVVVVDPGVGTARRALACAVDGRYLVGPDNGVFSRVLRSCTDVRSVVLEPTAPPAVSRTFHGRDIFAPAAARLLTGATLGELGTATAEPVLLPDSQPERTASGVRGTVVHVDRFGNLITDISAAMVTPGAAVRIGDSTARRVATYAEGSADELIAVIGSRGLLEISVRDGSAAASLRCGRGTAVFVFGAS